MPDEKTTLERIEENTFEARRFIKSMYYVTGVFLGIIILILLSGKANAQTTATLPLPGPTVTLEWDPPIFQPVELVAYTIEFRTPEMEGWTEPVVLTDPSRGNAPYSLTILRPLTMEPCVPWTCRVAGVDASGTVGDVSGEALWMQWEDAVAPCEGAGL